MSDVAAEFFLSPKSSISIESEVNTHNTLIEYTCEIQSNAATWGSILGNIENQEDLQQALSQKADIDYVDSVVSAASDTINARIDAEVETLNTEINKKVETITGSDLINVQRTDNAVTITSKTFVFEQAVPSTEWIINHNLNKRPSIDLTYYSGESFEAYREYTNNNQVIIRLENAATGYAYLN